MDIKKAMAANGLEERDRESIGLLCSVYDAKRNRNMLRSRFYQDKEQASNLGLTVPDDFKNLDVSVGWCAKAVDMIGSRSIIDAFSMAGGDDALMRSIVEANDLCSEYDKAKSSELIHSCGFWTIDAGEKDGEMPAILYHDAESGSAIWDYRKRRPKCGLVVYDAETKKNGGIEPVVMHAYFPGYTIVMKRNGKEWSAFYTYNIEGSRPLFESMAYRPTYARPFGRSVISRPAMAIQLEAQRELVRTALHSELFSAPQRYLLGVSEDALTKSKISLYMDALLMATRDENGDLPVIGQFAQASMEPHIKYIESLASRFAAECKLPVAALGVASNGYTSSDALRAASDDVIIEAEAMNRTNGAAMRNVMQMAVCVAQGKTLADMDEAERSIQAYFKNPSMPSISSQADAMVKIASVAPEFAATPTFFEQLGFSEPVRRRLESEMDSKTQRALTSAILARQ